MLVCVAEGSLVYRLTSILLEQPVDEWIAERRAEGMSWRRVAFTLRDITGNEIDVAPQTIVEWSSTPSFLIAGVVTGVMPYVLSHHIPIDEAALRALVAGAITALVTFAAAYKAKHTHRPDAPTPPPGG